MAEEEAAITPVKAQLDAYNARDLEAFLRHWHPDCVVHLFPDQPVTQGLDQLRAAHVERFREPNLHARLNSRIAVGNVVVDHETVTRTFPEGPGELEVIAIYEVVEGRIARAWFQRGAPRLQG